MACAGAAADKIAANAADKAYLIISVSEWPLGYAVTISARGGAGFQAYGRAYRIEWKLRPARQPRRSLPGPDFRVRSRASLGGLTVNVN
ncbi:hypothetical protein AYM39_09280 [Methylomonas sp. DH-1]|nr:hypothetical protein AYM39_09280 [Methylomonas sp. DH-1]